ncbi:GDSL-type esterase/lipase family protein [Anaeromyxobacter paludicola]|uniref:SGNH hydrolase-type esterase domain-containing protein n=1 Tax=Anaeromyxobacter paludicola TaxID=2918171 RepID=A0ABN6N2D4_9BACT|nr:GDSL-type esterase/lipase family protein [Anaeromyxobacter paludicola]BDG07346.1 hypothetical protein AMPC_04590 [Anaeromyxobacter paludicola]
MPSPFPRRALLALGALALTLAGAAHLASRRRPASERWGGPLRPAPLVSRGKPVASSPPGGAVLVDGAYRTGAVWCGGHPTPGAPAWVAIRVGRGPRRLLLSWSSSHNHDYDDVYYGAPADYRIETSSDSRDGADGHWRTVVQVTGNAVHARAHSFDFRGRRWVRLVVTGLPARVNPWGLFLDEVDLHDLSGGGDDVWLFLGDSITAEVFDRAPAHQPSFAEAIARAHPGYHPATLAAGLCNAHVEDLVRRIDPLLAQNPDVRVVAIGIGSNDNPPAPFRAGLAELVRRIRAAGRIPVLARVPFQTKYPFDYAAPLAAGVDQVTAEAGLLPGPDLYGWFRDHPERIADGLHPDDQGAVAVNRAWAEAVSPLYPP